MFDRRNEIAHSVPIGNPRKPGQIRFQDLRARIKLGEMPQPQVRTAKEISGYGRKLLRLCGELERALTQRGVLTLDQLHAIERANLELAAQMAHSQGDHRPPHSTKRKTPRQPAPSKGPERA